VLVATLEHVAAAGTPGLTYLDVLDTDEEFAFLYPQRKDSKTYSLRAQGSAGVEPLFLAGEYAHQDSRGGDEHAWYLEAGWSFTGAPWAPSVNYRYSRFPSPTTRCSTAMVALWAPGSRERWRRTTPDRSTATRGSITSASS